MFLLNGLSLGRLLILNGVLFHTEGQLMVCRLVDLAAVVGLAFERKIHWEASVDEGAPNAIPSNDHLVSLKMVVRDEHPRAILVDIGDMVVDQHPTVLLRRHAMWLLRWLTRPPDGTPYVVEAVAYCPQNFPLLTFVPSYGMENCS